MSLRYDRKKSCCVRLQAVAQNVVAFSNLWMAAHHNYVFTKAVYRISLCEVVFSCETICCERASVRDVER